VRTQRQHPRTDFIARTEVAWASDGGEIRIPGLIENKSAGGLGIQVSKAIAVGTPIKVKLRNQMVAAVVRRCQKLPIGFFIGVSFESEPFVASSDDTADSAV
jgi:hypothetical protein